MLKHFHNNYHIFIIINSNGNDWRPYFKSRNNDEAWFHNSCPSQQTLSQEYSWITARMGSSKDSVPIAQWYCKRCFHFYRIKLTICHYETCPITLTVDTISTDGLAFLIARASTSMVHLHWYNSHLKIYTYHHIISKVAWKHCSEIRDVW